MKYEIIVTIIDSLEYLTLKVHCIKIKKYSSYRSTKNYNNTDLF